MSSIVFSLGGEEKGCPYASMGRRPVAAALLCAAVSALPALRPRKNTIACADPLAAQDFTPVSYTHLTLPTKA